MKIGNGNGNKKMHQSLSLVPRPPSFSIIHGSGRVHSRAYGKAGNGNETNWKWKLEMETGNENWKWKLEMKIGNENWKWKWEQKTHQSLSLVPRPPPVLVLWFAFSIIQAEEHSVGNGIVRSSASVYYTERKPKN